MRKAFTLIELLIVVLVIGILAAIAVPHYERTITRAHIMSGLAIGRGLMSALDEYYLANGGFTAVYDKLSLSIPSNFTDKDGNVYTNLKSTDAIYYDVGKPSQKMFKIQSGGVVQYQYTLPNGKYINIYFVSTYATADSGANKGRVYCTGQSNSNAATAYCKLIGGVKDGSKYYLN